MVNGKEVSVLHKLQNCYGIAIRQTCQRGDVNITRKGIGVF